MDEFSHLFCDDDDDEGAPLRRHREAFTWPAVQCENECVSVTLKDYVLVACRDNADIPGMIVVRGCRLGAARAKGP